MVKCSKCNAVLGSDAKFCTTCGTPRDVSQLKFGEFEVHELIGEGGMGRVYRAVQPRLKREVCIKTLHPRYTTNAEVVARFEREALTMAQLKHPNIIAVHDVGRASNGTAYIVMELVAGRSLRALLKADAPLPPARAQQLVDQILAALAEAHANGIVHRDLKPANVLVVPLKDGSELVKVLDFGIARAIDDGANTRLTRAGHLVGTPGYMAPEQLSEDHDHRVDVYAAGVILFEALTGQKPFSARNEIDLLQKLLTEEAPPPSTRLPSLGTTFDAVCTKALARAPERRFATAREFREALARALGLGPPSPASTPPTPPPEEPLPPSADSIRHTASFTSPTSILATVLAAAREQQQRLETLSRTFEDLFEEGRDEQLMGLLRAVKAAASDKANETGVAQVLSVLRPRVISGRRQVLAWTKREETRALGTALLRLGGRELIGPMVTELGQSEPGSRGVLVNALHVIEPKAEALFDLLRDAPDGPRLLLQEARAWPVTEAAPVFALALGSPLPATRQLALDLLTESVAALVVTSLRARLHDPQPKVRGDALRWIHALEDAGAVGDLERVLQRPASAAERLALVTTLAHVAGPQAAAVLRKLFDAEADEPCLVGLAQGLIRCAGQEGRGAVVLAARRPALSKPTRDALMQLAERG